MKIDIDAIAEQLEAARQGSGFEPWRHKAYAAVLVTAFGWKRGHGIDTVSGRTTVAHEAIREAAKTPPITREGLERALAKRAKSFLARRRRYVVATHLSLQLSERKVFGFSKNTVRLTMTPGPVFQDRRLQKAREDLLGQPRFGGRETAPQQEAAACRVAVRASTTWEAAEIAEATLYQVCGLLHIHKRSFRRIVFGSSPGALIEVSHGPATTVHSSSGALAADTVWLDTSKRPAVARLLPEGAWEAFDWYKEAVRSHPYRRWLERVIARCGRAFADSELDTVIVQLWGILETLTDAGRSQTIVKRAASLVREESLQTAVLKHIARTRHVLVHQGMPLEIHGGGTSDAVASELAGIVLMLVRFHLETGRELGKVDRAARFLDLPRNPKVLRMALEFVSD